MPPKRKRVGDDETVEKRQKMSNDLVDVSFQHLNDDTSKIIINFLTHFMRDLVALSLTSSSWHTKINKYLNQSIKKLLPLTYNNLSIAQRNKDCEGFFKTAAHITNVQIFAYKPQKGAGDEPSYGNVLYVVPWDSNIVIHQSNSSFSIFDLTKNVALVSLERTRSYGQSHPKVAFNEKNRLLAIRATTIIKDSLFVYSVDQGQVLPKCDVVLEEGDVIGEGELFIDDDRNVWIMSYSCKRFSVDQNKLIEPELKFGEEDYVIFSARQAQKGIDIYYRTEDEEYEDVPIRVLNSATNKSKQLLRLPNYDYPPIIDWQKNHIAVESPGSNCSHYYVFSRDATPKLRLYISEYNGASINVSLDGTRFTFDLNQNSFKLYEITGYRAPSPGEGDEDEEDMGDEDMTEMDRWFAGSNIEGNRFSRELREITVNDGTRSTIGQTEENKEENIWVYQWASNDVIVGFSVNSMVVIDLSTNKTEYESFELPLKAQWIVHGSSAVFVDEKTFMISAYSDETYDDLFICKITI